MVSRFYVHKFITIEDRLLGLVTFRQLFSLLGAFFVTIIFFRINQLLGIIIGLISFALVFLFTFVKINGKLFFVIFLDFLDNLFNKKYSWQKIEKISYKTIEMPIEISEEISLPQINPSKRKTIETKTINIEHNEVQPPIKEEITISLNEPMIKQIEKINKTTHIHLINPKNPYRLFPYLKFKQK